MLSTSIKLSRLILESVSCCQRVWHRALWEGALDCKVDSLYGTLVLGPRVKELRNLAPRPNEESTYDDPQRVTQKTVELLTQSVLRESCAWTFKSHPRRRLSGPEETQATAVPQPPPSVRAARSVPPLAKRGSRMRFSKHVSSLGASERPRHPFLSWPPGGVRKTTVTPHRPAVHTCAPRSCTHTQLAYARRV